MTEYVKRITDFWSNDLNSHKFTTTYELGNTRDYHHENFRDSVTRCSQSFNEELPKIWPQFLQALNLDAGSVSWTLVEPGRVVPVHQDYFVNLRKQHNVSVEDCARYIIMLEDWSFGQIVEFEDCLLTKWKKGDVWEFDYKVSHWAANVSNNNFYTCQVSFLKNE
jgi:hypothetical protein